MSEPNPTPASPARVGLRMRVQIELVSRSGESEPLEFIIVPEKDADFYSGYLSESTPMARAILGRAVGSAVPYTAGDGQEIRILSATPAGEENEKEAAEAAARRKAAVDEARRQSDRTNAIIFASSFEGKWGGYDADSIDENWK
jgi:hypothetical protein